MLRAFPALVLAAWLAGSTPGWAVMGYGTFVTLADGTMRVVQALKRGDKLAGPDTEQREIFAISTVENAELVTIITNKGRKLVVGKGHPIPIIRGEAPFIASDIRVGDRVYSIEGFETVEIVEAAKPGIAYKLSIGEPGTSERDPLYANGLMVSDEPI